MVNPIIQLMIFENWITSSSRLFTIGTSFVKYIKLEYTECICRNEVKMKEIREQIESIIHEIEVVSDYLYQQKVTKGYEILNSTLEKIMGIADKLFAMTKENLIDFDMQRLFGTLTSAMQAMEVKDNVLLADILVYEVAGQLQEITN